MKKASSSSSPSRRMQPSPRRLKSPKQNAPPTIEREIMAETPPIQDNFQQAPPAVEAVQPSSGQGMAIAALVLSILSFCFFCIGPLLGIPAIVLGLIVLARKIPGKGKALAGLATGSVSIILFIIYATTVQNHHEPSFAKPI